MDIEALVTKYERLIPAGAYTLAEGIRAALTELAEEHAIEMRAYEATVQNQAERIRQLEAERVPDVRCKCCGYLVTESEHRGCLRSAIDGHLLSSLRLAAEALHALTDRNITYVGNDAVLPFDSNAQAFNHMIDARRHAKEAMAMLAAAPAKKEGEKK